MGGTVGVIVFDVVVRRRGVVVRGRCLFWYVFVLTKKLVKSTPSNLFGEMGVTSDESSSPRGWWSGSGWWHKSGGVCAGFRDDVHPRSLI